MNTRKTALVTGSGKRRIGNVIVEALAERGFAVAVHYNTSARDAEEAVEKLRKKGVPALALQADLRQQEAVKGLVAKTLAEFGRLDVLVNCAATWPRKPLEQVTGDDVRNLFETNTLSTFLCCQYGGLAMVKQAEGGSIINFGDWAVARPYPDYPAYFASKGAIGTITRTFAVELALRNPRVRVNCVLPGPVMLPPDLPEAERKQAIEGTLVKREGTPSNVADAVLFLVDNDFVTGVCLPVDGGRTVFAAL